MFAILRRAGLPALVSLSLALGGCALQGANQPLSPDVARVAQPLDVTIGIPQVGLYAQIETSKNAGRCGTTPGMGFLLAAACGAIVGTVDAKINAGRARGAEAIVQPLQDAIVDLQMDQLLLDEFKRGLIPLVEFPARNVELSKAATEQVYQEKFLAAEAASVLFVNVDYHLSADFSTVRMSARSLLYPRSPAARSAAGLSQSNATRDETPMALGNTAFRGDYAYELALDQPQAKPKIRAGTWGADGARLLRKALQEGTAMLVSLLKEDLKRDPRTAQQLNQTSVHLAPGLFGDLVAERDGGKLVRLKGGALLFRASIAPTAPAGTTSAEAAQ